jgi:flagellar assembly protein FliH
VSVQKVLPGADGADAQPDRWRLPEMDAPRSARSAPAPTRRPPTVEEIERIQRQARREGFEQGRREGHEQGYGEGLAQGRAQGEAEVRERAARLEGLLQGLADPASEVDEATEEELARLTLALARQVIRRELQAQPGEIIGVIREAVALLPLSAREIRLRLHPEDAALVRDTLGDQDARWQIEEDPSISRGGCLLRTQQSRVDATVEHRIAALAAELLGDARRPDEGAAADREDA